MNRWILIIAILGLSAHAEAPNSCDSLRAQYRQRFDLFEAAGKAALKSQIDVLDARLTRQNFHDLGQLCLKYRKAREAFDHYAKPSQTEALFNNKNRQLNNLATYYKRVTQQNQAAWKAYIAKLHTQGFDIQWDAGNLAFVLNESMTSRPDVGIQRLNMTMEICPDQAGAAMGRIRTETLLSADSDAKHLVNQPVKAFVDNHLPAQCQSAYEEEDLHFLTTAGVLLDAPSARQPAAVLKNAPHKR